MLRPQISFDYVGVNTPHGVSDSAKPHDDRPLWVFEKTLQIVKVRSRLEEEVKERSGI